MSSVPKEEIASGIAILEGMCSQLKLGCITSRPFNAVESIPFDLNNRKKEVRVRIGPNFLADLPGTKALQSSLFDHLHTIALRFPQSSFSEFETLTGIPVSLKIEFPFQRSAEGGAFEYVHVFTQSGLDREFEANFSVHLSRTIQTEIVSLEAVITQSLIINAVRKSIDDKKVFFYPVGQHPTQLQTTSIDTSNYDYKAKGFNYHKVSESQAQEFLKEKVYRLGFRRGDQTTCACIADPDDSIYLGLTFKSLQQAAAILAANGFINLEASGLHATVGTKLLREATSRDRRLSEYFDKGSSIFNLNTVGSGTAADQNEYDVFISHASEDKPYVEPLVKALREAGIRVWFDQTSLEWGDDLRTSIDRGLTKSRYGIVVFSKSFVGTKKWTEYELNSLFALEQLGDKLILPIWHEIERKDLLQYSPAFADRLAKISSQDSYEAIVMSLKQMLRNQPKLVDVRNHISSNSVKLVMPSVRPCVVAVRYGRTPDGHFGLFLRNDGEPAFDISAQNVNIGPAQLQFDDELSGLTKEEGETFYEAFVNRGNGKGFYLGGLKQVMIEATLESVELQVRYKDRDQIWYQTIHKIERDVKSSEGIKVRFVEQHELS